MKDNHNQVNLKKDKVLTFSEMLLSAQIKMAKSLILDGIL